MRKPDFEKCTSEATKLLHCQDVLSVSDRILNIQNLVYDKTVYFESLQNYCQIVHRPITDFLSDDRQILKDGCTIHDHYTNCHLILYNADVRHFEHFNWTLAHEVGHLYLEHQKDDRIEEIEAHYFASQLFMPDYTLFMTARKYGKISVADVVEIFGVSETAAQKRIETMNKRTYFCASAKAKEIWEIQSERVDMYFKCKREGNDFRFTLDWWQRMKFEYERQCRIEAYANMNSAN